MILLKLHQSQCYQYLVLIFIYQYTFLNIHSDFQSHIINKNWARRLNLLLYFNKGWTEKNNGNIELWDKDLNNNFNKEVFPIPL